MKRFLCILILCFSAIYAEAQYTQLPSYQKKKPWTADVKIIDILTGNGVIIGMAVNSRTCDFNNATYLEYMNPSNGAIEIASLESFDRLDGFSPELANLGYTVYSLNFKPIPNGVNKINLISPMLQIWGISINTVEENIPTTQAKRMTLNESEIHTLINNSNLDIAGIYESMKSNNSLAVVKYKDTIYVLHSTNDERCGEVYGILRATSLSNVYKATLLKDRSAVITFDLNSMTITDGNITSSFIKMDAENKGNANQITQGECWTGTGYAMGDRFVVTNNHVANNAKKIIIKGINGDMNNGYSAEIIATDKITDIAILKLLMDVLMDLVVFLIVSVQEWLM